MTRYTLEDVRRNIQSVISCKKEENLEDITIAELLKFNHTLMWWAMAMGASFTMKLYDGKDISLINLFWMLLEEYGICLTQEEKIDVFENFLDD